MVSYTSHQSTSLPIQKSFNYPIQPESPLPASLGRQQTSQKVEQQAPSFIKQLHSVWSFFRSASRVSSELIFQEQQKVIKNWEESLSTFFISESQIQYIELLYLLQETEKIQRFLEENQFLFPLLITTFVHIQEYFPESTVQLNLDQGDEMSPQLVATILTNKSLDDAFYQLRQFDEQWWLDTLKDTELKLSINLEFE
jgi:hypothetical protein